METRQGLYDPRFEHDSCGVGFVVNIKGVKSREIINQGLEILENLEHRGATGAEVNTGDGAGILIQFPETYLKDISKRHFGYEPTSIFASGIIFLGKDSGVSKDHFSKICEKHRVKLIGFRSVPTNPSILGETSLDAQPVIEQVFIEPVDKSLTRMEFERLCYVVRKLAEREITDFYASSLSSRVLVYKGMLTPPQLRQFYPDLSDSSLESAIALVHSRFSTNTFPAWKLAHPYRYIAHNGEINTITGNRNWMRTREAMLKSDYFGKDMEDLFPIATPQLSDSASFDEVLELLHLGGRSLAHSVLMMIPEAWESHETMSKQRRAFYEFHATLMEAWDGPAAISFTDGTSVGAVLDRNGLRPARYWVTKDDRVIMASEVGVLDIDPSLILSKGRLTPGRMFLVDTSKGRIVGDDELKEELSTTENYVQWLQEELIQIEDVPEKDQFMVKKGDSLVDQRLFGYSEEELRVLLTPMARNGVEPIGSMGNDAPIAVLSDRARLLFDYFSQLFAQVTNPPLDAIREELVTSLKSFIGPEGNLLSPTKKSCHKIVLSRPILTEAELSKLQYIEEDFEAYGYKSAVIDGLFDATGDGESLKNAILNVCKEVDRKIEEGFNLIILSDRLTTSTMAPIPSLLLTGAVHHHLIRRKTRTKVGLIVESGDARETHHMALLLGYGASAVCPYVAIESVKSLVAKKVLTGINERSAVKNLVKAYSKGVLKVMSKMGISTVSSYVGAHVFEAVGLNEEVIQVAFDGTPSRVSGVGFDVIAKDVLKRHKLAFFDRQSELSHRKLEVGGEYQWRREGEYHLFNPLTVYKLQHSTRSGRYEIFKEYTKLVDDQSEHLATIRGLMKFKKRESISIEEVEPISEIVKRFSTGAMSYGSISKEAHETLAIAMNRLGGKSNTGEGGEDSGRFQISQDGDLRRSAIKQVASGRFGVTSEYLVNSDDIQIKMAQGAKPGEGGQLPGHKVYPWIAKTRFSTPGVGLISPPPHHDIYSIEDLAQLIHDLKNANKYARIHVKLVAEVGVGTVAAGVSKAHADVVLISGHDGGTGASPLSSIKHAGVPWELGLAETQQTLVMNGLRDRIVVQVDGQLKTGRDVVVAALLGAEEFGFATAPLVVSGCVMMRVCHLDTCPVGIATQNPELRKKFSGKPEFVENFFTYIAQEVREYLAELGLRSLDEAIGNVELLDIDELRGNEKTEGLDLSLILSKPQGLHGKEAKLKCETTQDHSLDKAIDNTLIELAKPALESKEAVSIELEVRNINRTVGTMLGAEISRRYGAEGLPDDTIKIKFTGSAGQSFGAFLPRGVSLTLVGDANDYLAKGLSGGKIIVSVPPESTFESYENIIAGNVILYGATSGETYLNGVVGERFCVRNSGALAVVEGVGDHACEYMTGGVAVVLGKTGRNFGAGMSGGVAYVYDPDHTFANRLNMEMVSLEAMEEDDLETVKNAISKHFKYTSSEIAGSLLESWDSECFYFKKVMPRDYRRVLDATKEALERGESVEIAVMAAAHG